MGVQGGGGFIQKQRQPIFVKRPGQSQLLGFAAGQVYCIILRTADQAGVHPLGKALDFFPKPRLLQHLLHFFPVRLFNRQGGDVAGH